MLPMSSLVVSVGTTVLLIFFPDVEVGTAATVLNVTDSSDLFRRCRHDGFQVACGFHNRMPHHILPDVEVGTAATVPNVTDSSDLFRRHHHDGFQVDRAL
jgi:hypothetical protein